MVPLKIRPVEFRDTWWTIWPVNVSLSSSKSICLQFKLRMKTFIKVELVVRLDPTSQSLQILTIIARNSQNSFLTVDGIVKKHNCFNYKYFDDDNAWFMRELCDKKKCVVRCVKLGFRIGNESFRHLLRMVNINLQIYIAPHFVSRLSRRGPQTVDNAISSNKMPRVCFLL